MSVEIRNRHIQCPECKADITVRRGYGTGATYVHEWDHLPKRCLDLLAVIISKPNLWLYIHTKDELKDTIQDDLKISANALNARLSELVGLGILQMIRYGEDDHRHYTVKAPGYRLDHTKACKILNDGGRLPKRLDQYL